MGLPLRHAYSQSGKKKWQFLFQKNEGWSDIDGHVFIYFTIEALAEVLHKSQMTIKTALAVLEKQELIFRKRQGPGQPNRIYVKLPKETIHYIRTE